MPERADALARHAPPSLAINAGMTPAELSAAGIEPPRGDVQLALNPRLVGGRYDLGAFESSVDDDPDRLHISGFE